MSEVRWRDLCFENASPEFHIYPDARNHCPHGWCRLNSKVLAFFTAEGFKSLQREDFQNLTLMVVDR